MHNLIEKELASRLLSAVEQLERAAEQLKKPLAGAERETKRDREWLQIDCEREAKRGRAALRIMEPVQAGHDVLLECQRAAGITVS